MMCHFKDIQINRKSPVTKTGKEIPSKTKTELAVSRILPLLRAAKIPKLTPMINQRISAPTARLMVIGNACAKSVDTQVF